MDRLSLGRPNYPSDEQRVARPYRDPKNTRNHISIGCVRARVRTEAWNSVGHLRCKWQPLLSKVAYRANRREGSFLEEVRSGYDGGMRIELITTGSELLLGQVLNSHPGYLSGRLAMMGLELARQTAVPDGLVALPNLEGQRPARS